MTISDLASKPVTLLAHDLVTGPKRNSYGEATASFQRVATMWSLLLGHPVTPRQVCRCMIALKLARDANKSQRDCLVDICGYAELADAL